MADLPAPEEMTDEQLNQFLNGEEVTLEEEGKKDPPAADPPVDTDEDSKPETGEENEGGQPAAPSGDPAPAGDGEAKTPPAEEEPKPPSRREQLRVQQLLEKMQQREQSKTPEEVALPKALDYKEELEADDDTLKKLQDDRDRYGQDLYRQGRQEADSILFTTRLEIDAPRVEAKYPFLDPTSDQFNERRADTLNRRYLHFVGYDPQTQTARNPDIRYSEFIEAEMEFARELAEKQVAEASQNIHRQAAQTGLRPGGNTAPKLDLDKAPEDMTDDELKAKLATVFPTR